MIVPGYVTGGRICSGIILSLCLVSEFAIAQTPPTFIPSTLKTLNVTFNGHINVTPGRGLEPSEAWQIPSVASIELEIYEPHIALMVDTEIINDGVAYPVLHWYQADLWVNTQTDNAVLHNFTNNGAEYVGPQPNPGPSHTYVLLLFRQPLNYKFPKCYEDLLPLSVEARRGFDLHDFLVVAGLTDLVAANYFMCQDPKSRPTSTYLNKRPCATHPVGGHSGTEAMHVDLKL